MALIIPIFTKITDVEWHYVEIPHIEFHQSQSSNAGSRGRNLFTTVSIRGLRNTIFTKLTPVLCNFLQRALTPYLMKPERTVQSPIQGKDKRKDISSTQGNMNWKFQFGRSETYSVSPWIIKLKALRVIYKYLTFFLFRNVRELKRRMNVHPALE
jgi:hypothetical protein